MYQNIPIKNSCLTIVRLVTIVVILRLRSTKTDINCIQGNTTIEPPKKKSKYLIHRIHRNFLRNKYYAVIPATLKVNWDQAIPRISK